jgi:hypothetical protein
MQDRMLSVGHNSEIRPEHPVEQMLVERVDHRLARVNNDRALPPIEHGIQQERQASYVIEMAVRKQYVVDADEFLHPEFGDAGTCVEQDIVIQ